MADKSATKKNAAGLSKKIGRHWKPIVAVLVVALLVIVIVPRDTQKKVAVSGAWALYPMMVKWAEEYQKIHPDVKIDVSAGGAGKGMSDALSGLVDIGMISRSIYQEEIDQGAFYVSVVKDAVVATINTTNPVLQDLLDQGVTRETFASIFITGDVTNWGQVVGSDVSDAIHVYTRSDSCGAADTWAAYLGKKQDDLTANPSAIGVYGDPGIAEAVQKDVLGIGYNNIGYAYDLNTGLPVSGITVVPIDINGNGAIEDNESFYANKVEIVQAIANGDYPSPPARNLHLVTKDQFSGAAKDFVTWILTDGQQYVPEAGYINLPQEMLEQQLAKIQ